MISLPFSTAYNTWNIGNGGRVSGQMSVLMVIHEHLEYFRLCS